MRLIIPRPGKRRPDDDGFEEDVAQLLPMTEKSIGRTNWASGPPKVREEIPETPGAIVMGRPLSMPEPGPSKETEPEPVKEETRREKYRRLKTEVEALEREKKESSKND